MVGSNPAGYDVPHVLEVECEENNLNQVVNIELPP